MKNIFKNENGQSLVEFALVIPLFLMIVVGVIDFGGLFYTNLQMEMVTQEATRLAGLGNDDTTIRSYAEEKFQGNSDNLTVAITPDEVNRNSGEYVTVKLSYPTEFLNILGDFAIPYALESSSTIRVE
ncbi:TadE-like protein [Gracilibacillus ureilyticus]|uniref:TadE-like protein n=1 Tax=Gracilibacillus ureilyticus TaxID=531814 RepID=A0A1H9V4L0_9BACI|nr:TadE/TadG family type IV pilus assembly protein [Gracilibacillus ureilyticus]SES16612.1 TadE-like protein [Gracilibacillus ureilyticus]